MRNPFKNTARKPTEATTADAIIAEAATQAEAQSARADANIAEASAQLEAAAETKASRPEASFHKLTAAAKAEPIYIAAASEQDAIAAIKATLAGTANASIPAQNKARTAKAIQPTPVTPQPHTNTQSSIARTPVTIAVSGQVSGKTGAWAYDMSAYKGNQLCHKQSTGTSERTTRNLMALNAIIAALSALKRPCAITLLCDNKYVTDAINNGQVKAWRQNNWKIANGKTAAHSQLWSQIVNLTVSGNHLLKVKYYQA